MHRRLGALRPAPLAAVGLAMVLVVTLLTATTASASLQQVITSQGDQQDGRWQVFDLDTPTTAVDVVAQWTGTADVNIFLKDAQGETVSFANGSNQPEYLRYDGDVPVEQIAILVASGAAQVTTTLHEPGTSPWLADNGFYGDVTEPSDPDEPGQSGSDERTIEGQGGGSYGARGASWTIAPSGEPIVAVATWGGNADVNLFLEDARGRVVAAATSRKAMPERLVYDGSADVVRLRAEVRSGGTAYTISVSGVGGEDPTDPPTEDPTDPPTEDPTDPPTEDPTDPPTEDPTDPPTDDPTTPEPENPDGFEPAYPGQTAPGTVLWGGHRTGNGDPEYHEVQAGATMGVHRTFFQWRHRTDYLLRTATEDVAEGRVPWVSTKTPSWAAMAAGDHDAEIDELLRGLDALDGPVWLTVHHEPEGGGGTNSPDDPAGPSGHVAMNRQVRERMDALGTDNIALAPVLMAYSWNPSSGRDPDAWWDPEVYDFMGVDDYAHEDSDDLLGTTWFTVRDWAGRNDTDISLGEWNMTGSDDAAYDRFVNWYDHAVGSADDGRGGRVVGLAVYESERWPDLILVGGRLRAYHDLMARDTSVTQE